ncbi:MAG: peptide deformylase [Bacteroidota bacterium]|nr:peptide deformylase [Bacteroidota bacterium]
MILPVTAYGHPVLKKVAEEIDKDYPQLDELISDMWDTMYHTVGVGLAAPQINRSIRLFVIDATPYEDEIPDVKEKKKVFFNAKMIEEEGEEWFFSEGCLSIPKINEDVSRKKRVHIQYYDENWEFRDEWYDGVFARIIQHEYDHIQGIVFVDRLSSMKRTLLRRKLSDIINGRVDVDYKMIFQKSRKGKK